MYALIYVAYEYQFTMKCFTAVSVINMIWYNMIICYGMVSSSNRGGVHCQDIDAICSHFDGQARGELRYECLACTIHYCKGVWNVSWHGGGEQKAATQLLFQHLLQEMVRYLNASGTVAFQVGQLRVQGGLVEETGHYVARVIEHDGDVNVIRSL